MPLLTFFARLAREADCAILLDAGHLVSYELATGRSLADEMEGFPVERVVELHVAGGRIEAAAGKRVYVDAHDRPILDETWAMARFLVERLPALRAVCFECEGRVEADVKPVLARLRRLVVEHGVCTALVRKVREELHGPR